MKSYQNPETQILPLLGAFIMLGESFAEPESDLKRSNEAMGGVDAR